MGRFTGWLLQQQPRSGRAVNEDGEFINEADLSEFGALTDPLLATFRGQAYFYQHRFDLATQPGSYSIAFTTSPTKHTVVYSRLLTSGQGPVELVNIIGATFTAGTAGPAGLPTILPPSTNIILQVINRHNGANNARLAIAFAELTIPARFLT